ncbi:chemokine-like receptor 1 [Notolabrus celidotus]|uniref:chemokine-like receptor 1 n=1 Tax=Notolabrus celidotus TaxID=1203425 RepID=UPI0014904FEF|nr:chemokine-like receptor 1 [Notolabrus celidotus]
MGTANNSSVDQQTLLNETLRIESLASLIIYCVIFVLGILGNSLVIYVTGFRMKRTVNSVWFLNLALADFLFTVFLIFFTISVSQNMQWQFGRLMCKLNNFVTVVNMFASIFLLTAISLDRCLSIWVVVWAQNQRTVRKAQIISVVIWVMSGVCSIPYATFRDVQDYTGKTYCSNTASPSIGYILMVFRFVIGFLIPFLVIFVSYVAIAVRAGRLQRIRKGRSRKIIFSVVLAFFICWLPFHVIQFIHYSGNSSLAIVVQIGGTLSVCLAYLNSCLNPILYVFMCDEFQSKLKKSICLVFESALAEDHLTFMSSRSLSSQLSRISRKSDATTPLEGKGVTKFKFTECKDSTAEEEH